LSSIPAKKGTNTCRIRLSKLFDSYSNKLKQYTVELNPFAPQFKSVFPFWIVLAPCCIWTDQLLHPTTLCAEVGHSNGRMSLWHDHYDVHHQAENQPVSR
jgi:hypothetical protein